MGWPRAAGSLWPSPRAGDTAPTPELCLPGPGGGPWPWGGAPDPKYDPGYEPQTPVKRPE